MNKNMEVSYIKQKQNIVFLTLVIGVGILVTASYINSISGSLLSTSNNLVGHAGSKLSDDPNYLRNRTQCGNGICEEGEAKKCPRDCGSLGNMQAFDVRRFGAIPNDGKDDSTAFQKAMDACLTAALAGPSESLTVHLPIGIFNINSMVKGACSIEGENRATSLLQYEGTAPITMLQYDAKSHFSIKNLGFKNTKDGHQTTHIHIKDSVYFVIDDVASWVGTTVGGNNKVTGIYVEGTANGPKVPPRGTGEIRNYLYTARPNSGKPGAYGIHIHGNGQSVEGVVIDGTYNIEEADVGVFFENTDRNALIGQGTIGGHTTANLKFTNADANLITGVRLTSPTSGKQIVADANSENNRFLGLDCFNPVFCGTGENTYGIKAVVLNGGGDSNNINAINSPLGIGTSDPGESGKVNSKLTIRADDGLTGLAVMNRISGDRRFAINPNSDGSWTMYDGANGKWNKGITQNAGNLEINGALKLVPASAPANPSAGTVYFDAESKHFFGFDGSTWKQLDS